MPLVHLPSTSATGTPPRRAWGPGASLLSVLDHTAHLSAVVPDWATFPLHPLDQGSADIFCKGTNNVRLRLWVPFGLWQILSSALVV